MRIAISADGNQGLESPVGQHFGRCPYFILVDVEGQEVKAVTVVENPYYGNHAAGQVPAFISSQGADVMLAGGMGGRAVDFFRQYGIQPVSGASGTVRDALSRYLGGELSGVEACAESRRHHHA
jgi:predicted Fe-Mo cluster-binding NifX family protein